MAALSADIRRNDDAETADLGDGVQALWHLRPPQLNPDFVDRGQLIERLRDARTTPFINIVAPAGYGKTTLLSQWADRESRPVAWVSLHQSHNDPTSLLVDLLASLRTAGLIYAGAPAQPQFAAHSVLSVGVSRLVAMVDCPDQGAVLMLDRAESMTALPSNDVLAQFVDQLEGRVQVAVASRQRSKLPLETWRARGHLFELGGDDLRMTPAEAVQLLGPMGVDGDHMAALVESTEGWPVLLTLAGLALRSGSPAPPATIPKGDDRFILDYIRDEILQRVSKRQLQFLIQTSMLNELNGQLCDYVLDVPGSSQMLASLEDASLPIVSLDRPRRWYRTHNLLRDVLRRQLEDLEPERRLLLQRRAAEWYEANGFPEQAIEHAQACGDSRTVARIVEAVARDTFASGRASSVVRWLKWLEARDEVDRYPTVAGIGSMGFTLTGDWARADRWVSIALAGDPRSPYALLARALGCRGGIDQMRCDAMMARAALPAGSEWTPVALVVEAIPSIWEGDLGRAEPLLAAVITTEGHSSAFGAMVIALAERAVIAVARGDWSEADHYASRSLKVIRDHGIEGYLTSGLGLVMAARCANRRGDVSNAKNLLAIAANLRPVLNQSTAGTAAQILLEMATAHLELTDVAAARTAMREAEDILTQRPQLGVLDDRLAGMKSALENIGSARIGAFSLTKAELRLLPLLSTHLTFPEIGERLFISRHTVKTEATSIYRKLGVSSRADAIERARAAGFLSS